MPSSPKEYISPWSTPSLVQIGCCFIFTLYYVKYIVWTFFWNQSFISKNTHFERSILTQIGFSLVPRPSSRAVDPLPQKLKLNFCGKGSTAREEGLGTRLDRLLMASSTA